MFSKIRNKTVSALTICIQHYTGGSSQCKKARKPNKRNLDWKGRKNADCIKDDIIDITVHIEKDGTTKNPRTTEFSKIVEYKTDI